VKFNLSLHRVALYFWRDDCVLLSWKSLELHQHKFVYSHYNNCAYRTILLRIKVL